jgi:oxygen-independent coproporphyrinogen III oxidase
MNEKIIKLLKKNNPQIFEDWNKNGLSKFHLSKDLVNKFDGNVLETYDFLKNYSLVSFYDHTVGCISNCDYCGFFTKYNPSQIFLEEQINFKEKELNLIFQIMPNTKISSLYFGGGTPTILPLHLLDKLLKSYTKFQLLNDAEITVETHPGTTSLEKLNILKNYGVNRLSIGVQTLNDDLLRKINRNSTRNESLNAIYLAKKLFPVVNVDTIFGLEYQTIDNHLETLKELNNLNVDQITTYSLWLKKDIVNIKNYPSPEKKFKMYIESKNYLENQGYNEDLIGFFSKKNKSIKNYVEKWFKKNSLYWFWNWSLFI